MKGLLFFPVDILFVHGCGSGSAWISIILGSWIRMRIKAKIFVCVSPAYGFSALALVKCSNEECPGPRHNMKEDPGTSTLIMKGEHGQEVPCDPGQVTTILGRTCPPLLPPPPGHSGQNTLPPPFRGHTPPPAPVPPGGQPRRKHTAASGTRSEAMGWTRGG